VTIFIGNTLLIVFIVRLIADRRPQTYSYGVHHQNMNHQTTDHIQTLYTILKSKQRSME